MADMMTLMVEAIKAAQDPQKRNETRFLVNKNTKTYVVSSTLFKWVSEVTLGVCEGDWMD